MLVKDKQFYKSFLLLCLPIVLQNVIALSVNLADNIMLGSYSEAALSGATAVNQIQFIYQNILMGIGDSGHEKDRLRCHAGRSHCHGGSLRGYVPVPGPGHGTVYQ